MNITSIVFDLDGVICSTDKYHYLAWKSLADDMGIYFDEQINNRLRGVSRMESLEIILESSSQKYSEEEKQKFAELKNFRYRKLLRKMSPADLSDDVSNALQTLRRMGLKLAIGSSSKNTALILHQIGLDCFFDAVADGTQITHSKPDPEVFLLAARLLNVQPAHAIVVEDAIAGIRAAKAGGFIAVGIGDAAACGDADYSIQRLSDLMRIIEE